MLTDEDISKIRAGCLEEGLTLIKAELQEKVLILALSPTLEVDRLQRLGMRLKTDGYRWVALDMEVE